MATIVKEKKVRSRLERLRKAFEALDYRSADRESRFKQIDNRITQLLRDLPKMTGSCDTAIKLTTESARILVQEIKDKRERHRKNPAARSNHVLCSGRKSATDETPSHLDSSNALLGKRKRSRSPDRVLEDSESMENKKAKISRGEDDDDDDCVITLVLKCSKEEQEAIEAGLARRDEALWYDPSKDFDEDMLP